MQAIIKDNRVANIIVGDLGGIELDELADVAIGDIYDPNTQTFSRPPEDISRLRAAKEAELRSAFAAAAIQPVEVNGVLYNGGIDSALRLDGARRLALETGLKEVVFYDTSNQPHLLSLADALQVCLAVGGEYQRAFAGKQKRLTALVAAVDIAAINNV